MYLYTINQLKTRKMKTTKTKYEFLTRLIAPDKSIVKEFETTCLDDATLNLIHHTQVTFEDAENDRFKYGKSYTHVMEFRDDEHYNDLYFN